MTKVVHCKKEEFDVYIGSDSIWSNPFKMYSETDRTKVIEQYEEYIRNKPELLNQLHTLKDKVLGCWCKPKPCHGDVLVKLIEELNI